ncbi:MAG: 1-deoxy-D-xylulose-5-phosphate synthase [Defluviitaleaceae bacterium]|nr:1-deoxy-D-xylulose-5-phosphate synthase [Defluviitaleaceae bacterium]
MKKYLDKIKSPADLKKIRPPGLVSLCGEIRLFLVETVAKTGGHLASNLGVVELTVALHYVFNTPKDKIVWDVGHQAYIHKLLTGRKGKFRSLRQLGGMSGFPKPNESPHDCFATGHSSTSISAALGFAVSRDLAGDDYSVIAVIGDGSMTGGLAYEAMNNAGRQGSDLLVILNDNQMSISENVGALSKHLSDMRIAPSYIGVKKSVRGMLEKMPVIGGGIERFIERAKDGIKYMLVPGVLFEELGFNYVGPVDGHDLEQLIAVLGKVRRMSGPVLLHVYTTKGKGYDRAETAPAKYHGVDSFNIETGNPLETKVWDTYSDVLGKAMQQLAEKNDKIVAVTAAMPDGTGLAEFASRYPERFFDVGIAESHAVTFSAAMAKNGFIPVVAIYSTFLQRSYDQILHDVCTQNLHVIFAIDRAGVSGPDGETHQGVFDISFLAHIPNITIMAPVNKREFIEMLDFAAGMNSPVAIRFPRGSASRVIRDEFSPIELGRAQVIGDGNKEGVAIVALGSMMEVGFEVYTRLLDNGYNATLINPRFIKPIDADMANSLREHRLSVVLEDNAEIGGFASMLPREGKLLRFAFPDEFIEHGERWELLRKYGMDAESVYERIERFFAALRMTDSNG